MIWRFLYSIIFHLALPLVLLRLWRRGRSEPGYRQHIGERFGFSDIAKGQQGVVWIHAVSVGEVRAALPLIDKLRAAYPSHPMLLTCMTPTGRRTAHELLGNDICIGYLPYDLTWCVTRLIRRIKPAMLIIMETEVWPNLLATCRTHHVPCFLANARLSEKSRMGYAKFAATRAITRDALHTFNAIFAQSQADADRLASLGAKDVLVMGNIKFDLTLDDVAITRGQAWKAQLHNRPVILLASTRDNEEAMLMQAFLRVPSRPQKPLLVIVPRHPSRFDDVSMRLESDGFAVMRRRNFNDNDLSQLATTLANADVLLGDTMGEMQSYIALCDIAIIGGSFQPLGGQNLIEPAAQGKPVIVGPSVFNFGQAVADALAADAIEQVTDANAAMRAANSLLANPERYKTISDNASKFSASHRGATARTVAAIQQIVSLK
jgi:3-deoxy-D-manno-octulosonic-acid transferase